MPSVLWRPITPKRQKILDADRVAEELGDSLDALKASLIEDFQSTTSTWKTQVSFAGRKYMLTDELRLTVYPTGPGAEIWTYVNNGTRPHLIVPKKRGGRLRFKGGYQAKTRPGRIAAGAGGASGPETFAAAVRHPGTVGRHFERPIARKHRPEFRRLAENGLRRAVRR